MRLPLLFLSAVAGLAQSGGFQAGVLLPADPGSVFAVADLNLDNRMDIAVANRGLGAGVSVFLQTAAGGFVTAPASPALFSQAADIVSGDFNNDGKTDLAFAVGTPAQVRVWLGAGTGQFSTILPPFALDASPIRMRAADFDRDGNLDLAVLSAQAVRILRGNGTGSMTRDAIPVMTLSVSEGFFGGMDAGDINGDGAVDLAAVSGLGPALGYAPRLLVGLNGGSGQFSVTVSVGTGNSCCVSPLDVELADVTGDGLLDALTRQHLWTNIVSGSFGFQNAPAFPATISNVAAADLNFDRIADWIAVGPESMFVGLSTGQDVQPVGGSPFPFSSLSGAIAVVDVDGDHMQDVVVRQPAGLRILLNGLPYTPVVLPQQIRFDVLPDTHVAASPQLLAAETTSGLAVIFASLTPNVCDVVSNNQLRLFRAGLCTIHARQPGNHRFDPAESIVRGFTVSVSSQSISFGPLGSRSANDPPFSIVASATSGLPVTFAADPPLVCTISANVVTVRAPGVCTITASQPGNDAYAPAAPVIQAFTVAGAPLISAIGNAASYAPGFAPSSYGVILGSGLGPAPEVTLRDAAGVTHSLEPIFAGGTQINVIVPAGAALGQATVRVLTSVGAAEFPVTISPTVPGLFSANGSGQGLAAAQAVIVNSDKTVTTLTVADGPIPVRDAAEVYIILYGTGIRGHGPGVFATTAGRPVEVLYAGPQGVFPALDQVNLRLPLTLSGFSSAEIRLTVDGTTANVVTAGFR